jgi:assimilatory nitrate reductase catalytic subunit
MDGSACPVVKTTCPYCGVGCGVLARSTGDGVEITGDPKHPANFGRLCSKGLALGETLGLDGRLLTPMTFGRVSTWDNALDLVASRFSETIRDHGPDSVAFYVSGQLLTEDYYVANKMMKGFIGSANIDTNSRLCMASSVAGHKRAFGSDTVPGQYEDLEQADLVVLVGSNLAWCHPVLFQRLIAAKAARPGLKIVVLDPRRTATAEVADLHLPLAPGSDSALFNGLLAWLARGHLDPDFLNHVTGFDDALAAARACDPSQTGLSEAVLQDFYRLWAGTEKVVTLWSQGVNQSSAGTDKVNAIINCHLATGRIGKPGMGPFSVTGQPNAMGGREVGGLANMLACHLSIEDASHRGAVRKFWHAPTMATKPGLKAVDMFRAVTRGEIKAIWIIHTNPVVTMPEADRVRDALAACPFVVVSDISATTDTARLAHVLLPATGWGEKDGTVTNSERKISRQRAFLPAPGQTRPDWKILADVAVKMGFKGFDWTHPSEIFAEHAALSGVAASLGSDFDISAHAGIERASYDGLKPFTWPTSGKARFFGDGHFHTEEGKARMIAVRTELPPHDPETFRLNTGRNRDQWHTMTRSGKSPRLSQHLAEPYLEIHPADAADLALSEASLAEVTSPLGHAILRVLITDRVARGQVFAPMHWTGENAPSARIDALVAANPDPVSGQPDLKGASVTIRAFRAAWHGFAVSARPLHLPPLGYVARSVTGKGQRAELADSAALADQLAFARRLFDLPDTEVASVTDPKRGVARFAFHQNGHLVAALFIAPEPLALARDHIAQGLLSPSAGVLAGRPGDGQTDPGPVVCSCFNVGLNTIRAAIESSQALSVEAIGKHLGAGTNCGSCRPELAALLSRHRQSVT